MSAPRIVAYGEGAAFVDLDAEREPDRAARTLALASAIRAAWPAADVAMGAGTLAVIGVAPDDVARIACAPNALAPEGARRAHTIAAVYDGPDLAEAAASLGLTERELIARHSEAEYLVELIGFLPGFAYLIAPPGWPLALPRRASPRPRIPARSVGIAASFTGIYPFASPGGWNLVARAVDAVPFDPTRDPPALFEPGDRVRFTPADAPPRVSDPPAAIAAPPSRGLRIATAHAVATIQDRGRAGQLWRGLSASGPLDPETFAAANTAVGNDASAAAIEIPLGALEVEAHGGPAIVSLDGEPAVRLAAGERFRAAACDRAVRYLAVRGGIDVPLVIGARATLLAARLGGHLGRVLRRGDLLRIGDAAAADPIAPSHDPRDDRDLAIDPGPHLDRFPAGAYDALVAGPWRVSRLGDRVGVRLEGARVPRSSPGTIGGRLPPDTPESPQWAREARPLADLALPAPMIRGAIEITTDGTPIILGPDHPATGGYPVLAVLRASSHAALARKKPGDEVRFRA